MLYFRHLLIVLTLLTIAACRQTATKDTSKHGSKAPSETGKLIRINFADINYDDLKLYAKDTTTVDGWSINYYVKDDSTRYKDLYIVCSKGNIKGTYRAEDVLEFRRYFVPEFEAETKTNIYFTHGCATDCSAMLVFDKDPAARFSDYTQVVKYDVSLGRILYVTDTTYQNEEKIYELALVDIAKHKTHKLMFNGVCDGVDKPACVDTVIFSSNEVSVTVCLRKRLEDVGQTKQIKTFRL
jgi:hypothetical protein